MSVVERLLLLASYLFLLGWLYVQTYRYQSLLDPLDELVRDVGLLLGQRRHTTSLLAWIAEPLPEPAPQPRDPDTRPIAVVSVEQANTPAVVEPLEDEWRARFDFSGGR